MNAILNRLRKLSEDELLSVSEAIDTELERRLEKEDDVPDSARRRAIQRQKSYRHSLGSAALPVKVTGMKENDSRRRFFTFHPAECIRQNVARETQISRPTGHFPKFRW